MKLYRHILSKVLIPSVLSSITMVIVSTVIISNKFEVWIGDIGNNLITAELENIQNRMVNLQKLFSDIFSQIKSDTRFLTEYYIDSVEQYQGNQFYRSYSVLKSVDPDEPASSLDASNYFSIKTSNSTNFNQSSLMNDAFRAIYRSNTKYSLLYMGFEDSFFRRYPFGRAENYPTLTGICSQNAQYYVGYDPVCRSWYKLAQDNSQDVVFTAPYLFASTQKVAITAAKAILDSSNQLLGVVGIDISMESIDNILLNDQILTRGYAYIIDTSGNLVFYPNLKRDKTYKISNVEGITLNGTSGTAYYQKDGESWYISYVGLNSTNYILCISVPNSDITKSKLDLDSTSKRALIIVIIVAILVLLIITIVGILISRKISVKLIGPILALGKFLEKLTRKDFNQQLDDQIEAAEEIVKIYKNFKDLFEAVKFGNNAYYAGNMDKALENYEKVEKLMIKSDNQRGLGILYSNRANALRLMSTVPFHRVHNEYTKAIQVAENLLNSKASDFDLNLLKSDLAERIMNLAVFFMEQNQEELAQTHFDKALNIHSSIGNAVGIAKTSGNMAQFYIKFSNYKEATKLLNHILELADKQSENLEFSQKLYHHAYMNLGLLNLAIGKKEDAANYFKKSLNSTKSWEVQVARISATKLIEYYQEINRHDKIPLMQQAFGPLIANIPIKNVNFVLDTSGSMVYNIIPCRKSIKDIVNKLNNFDYVSLYTFNSEVKEIFQNFNIREKLSKILQLIDSETRNIEGQTAFYEALMKSMKKLNGENDWVVALTDGEDNRSFVHPGTIVENFGNNICNVFIITVGNLKNENEIKKICEIAQNYGRKGIHVRVNQSSQEIEDAFMKAGDFILRGAVVMQDL